MADLVALQDISNFVSSEGVIFRERLETNDDTQSTDSSRDLEELYYDTLSAAEERNQECDLFEALKLYESAKRLLERIHVDPETVKRLDKTIGRLKQRTSRFELHPSGFHIYNKSGDAALSPFLKQSFWVPAQAFDRLYWYQRDALRWMWDLHQAASNEHHFGGGILGDEMGLGKTVMIASFIGSLYFSDLITRVLLVLPKSLLPQWESELKKWIPDDIRVATFHGDKTTRTRQLLAIRAESGVCITTYEMVTKNVGDFESIHWDYIILDEGHKIRNHTTKQSKAVACLEANHRLLISGTPIMNHLDNLWSLFNWVCNGKLLGSYESFQKNFAIPIAEGMDREATESVKERARDVTFKLRSLIRPHFLRREKKDVFPVTPMNIKSSHRDVIGESLNEDFMTAKPFLKLMEEPCGTTLAPEKRQENLPALTVGKTDLVLWCSFTNTQLELYRAFINSNEVKEVTSVYQTKSPLAAITILKQICSHPQLLTNKKERRKRTVGGEISDEKVISTVSQAGLDKFFSSWRLEPEFLKTQSGKLTVLMSLLDNLYNEGHRVVLFSQSTKMLDIIEIMLQYASYQFVRIDGDVSKLEDRQNIIDCFTENREYFIFLATTISGTCGQGLNLVAADRVIIFDPAWNAMDEQAVDRVHRIGQTNHVIVYRLISCGSIEEKIYRKQIWKKSLTITMLDATQVHHRFFTKEELSTLFKLDDNGASSQTQQRLEIIKQRRREKENGVNLSQFENFKLDHHKTQFDGAKDIVATHLKFLERVESLFGLSDHQEMFAEGVAEEFEKVFGSKTESEDIEKPKEKKTKSKKKMENPRNAENSFDLLDTLIETEAVEISPGEETDSDEEMRVYSEKTEISNTNQPNSTDSLEGVSEEEDTEDSFIVSDSEIVMELENEYQDATKIQTKKKLKQYVRTVSLECHIAFNMKENEMESLMPEDELDLSTDDLSPIQSAAEVNHVKGLLLSSDSEEESFYENSIHNIDKSLVNDFEYQSPQISSTADIIVSLSNDSTLNNNHHSDDEQFYSFESDSEQTPNIPTISPRDDRLRNLMTLGVSITHQNKSDEPPVPEDYHEMIEFLVSSSPFRPAQSPAQRLEALMNLKVDSSPTSSPLLCHELCSATNTKRKRLRRKISIISTPDIARNENYAANVAQENTFEFDYFDAEEEAGGFNQLSNLSSDEDDLTSSIQFPVSKLSTHPSSDRDTSKCNGSIDGIRKLLFPTIESNSILRGNREESASTPVARALKNKSTNVTPPSTKISSMVPLKDALRTPSNKLKATFKKKREAYTKQLFEYFNTYIFDNLLPTDMSITWSNTLRTTAGRAPLTRRGSNYTATVELASKVIDSYEKLFQTFIHELCHCAAWIIDKQSAPPHGGAWLKWMRHAQSICPLVEVSACHTYEIDFKYYYECNSCGKRIGRFSKSKKLESAPCGYCLTGNTYLIPKNEVPRTPNAFMLFVKEHRARVKTENPELDNKGIMSILSVMYKHRDQ